MVGAQQQHVNSSARSGPWPRAIIHVDMNAFFASIEQRDSAKWQGKPIAIVNGSEGTCIITCSYEARAYGVKTGMRLREAWELCPHLIPLPARPHYYATISRAIMQVLTEITPDIEIFSVDEAFLDVTRCQRLHGTPEKMGRLVKQKIKDVSNLSCSVGVSSDKTTAKYAARLRKPDGLTIIPPWAAKEALRYVPVTALCGIGTGISNFLAKYSVYTCGDMERLPISILAQRFGNLGRRIWYMCQGADPDPVHTLVMAPKTMGHGKVMPPNTVDKGMVLTYLRHMSEKLAARLRRHTMQAQYFFIGVRSRDWGWLGAKDKVVCPTADGKTIFDLGVEVLKQHWLGAPIWQIQVTALDPRPADLQHDLFVTIATKQGQLNQVIDAINQCYGEFSVAPAPLLKRSRMNNVIAPAWKPYGHRQSI